MRSLRLVLVLISVAGLTRAAEIAVGDSRDDVLSKLAKPTSMLKRGDREIFTYANGGRVEFVDGKVDAVKGPLPDAGSTPAPAPATPPPTPKSAATAQSRPATGAATTTNAGAGATPTQPAGPKVEKVEAPPKSREEALQRAGVKLQAGPTTVALGKTAELKLPAGYNFVGPDSLDRFYQLTQNVRNGHEAGVILAPKDWMLFFEYNDIGYVKDEDKDKLDADKLMKAMTEGEDDANEERKKRGWDAMKLKGWATPPHYDEKTHNLKWAINLTSSHDNFKEIWINESIRILGRGGVMNVTLVTDTPNFKAAEIAADKLLADNYAYVAGEKYSEFKKGDKIAAYGLSALVLGGGAALAAKAGLFGKLGILLAKMWKAVVAVFVAIGVGIKKLFNKVTGANPPSA